jgi:sigma-B regulation protein RsbU (phosphoserine phosphatase)
MTAARRGIGLKIALLTLGGSSLALAAVLWHGYTVSKENILNEARTNGLALAQSVASKLEGEFRAVQKLPEAMAAFLETGDLDSRRLESLLVRMLADYPGAFGAVAAFEPYAFDSARERFAPYVSRSPSGGLVTTVLDSAEYDYFTKDWYHIPKTLGKPVWLDPYYDVGGGEALMTTYAVPFRHPGEGGAGKIRGVLTVDVSLKELTRLADSIPVYRTGFCFIVSDRGTFVTFRDGRRIMCESVFSVAEELGDERLRKVGQAMIRKDTGIADIGDSLTPGSPALLGFARIPSPGWAVGSVFPKSELFAQVDKLYQGVLALSFFGVVLLLGVSVVIGRSISKPLRRMAEVTRRVAHGDLDIDLPEVARTDEVGELARAFVRMAAELKKYITDLTAAVSARERIESELSIAADIQRQMLPSVFPAFPGRADFDIHALMRPAKEVGGDFYDFFLIDDDHLCVVVGDVSGKGVPASLFMSVTKYLIEAVADIGESPEGICARVNRRLALNNDSCMFVTVFLGVLNLKTGELLSANCGHTPPILGVPETAPEFMGPPGGPVLGVLEDATFRMDRTDLAPGAFLLVFTDGVTEAFNTAGDLFTEERLLNEMKRVNRGDAKAITEAVLAAVDSFAQDAPQADDITILTLKFTPNPA